MKLGKLLEKHSIFAVMRQLILATIVSILSIASYAQEQTADTLPYIKYPVLPTFDILNLDSSKTFSTYDIPEGRPIVMVFFSPDCSHCVHLGQEIVKHKEDFKKTRIYMATPMSLPATEKYADSTGLSQMKNVMIGKDHRFFCISFYGLKSFPFVAVYNGKKKLIEGFPGTFEIEDVIKAVERAE